MNLDIKHLIFWSADIDKAKEFYIKELGLEVLESFENFFAVRCGELRFSFFKGAKLMDDKDESTGITIIFKTDNVEKTKEEIISKGFPIFEDIMEAPGFMKHFSIKDPDGNIVYFGEYLKNPLDKS